MQCHASLLPDTGILGKSGVTCFKVGPVHYIGCHDHNIKLAIESQLCSLRVVPGIIAFNVTFLQYPRKARLLGWQQLPHV